MSPELRWSDPDNVREYAGWTGRETETPGVQSREYTHPDFPSWMIYENDPHLFAAAYWNGTKIQNYDSVADAVADSGSWLTLEQRQEWRDTICAAYDIPARLVPLPGEPERTVVPVPPASGRRIRAARPLTWFRR